MKRLALAPLLALAMVSLVLAGCSSSSTSQTPPTQSSAQNGAAPRTATETFPLSAAAATHPLPAVGDYSGSVAVPALSGGAGGGTLTVTSSLDAPAGSLLTADALRQGKATGQLTVLFYTTLTPSATITFSTLPGFTVLLPSKFNTYGQQFFYAISDPTATGVVAQFRTEGPATVSGSQLTFGASSTPLTLNAGQTYIFAFYATSSSTTPSPGPVSLLSTTPIPGVPPATGSFAFDIGFADQRTSNYYLADRTNASLDVFSTTNGSLKTQIKGFVGNTGTPATSGPDGVVPTTPDLIYVGDGGSRVRVVSVSAGAIVATINTGGVKRADEGCYDPKDQLVFFANNADNPAFISAISTVTNAVVGGGPSSALTNAGGYEQCVYNIDDGKVYISVPTTTANPGGEVDQIDPHTFTVTRVYGVGNCGPAGLSLGPNDVLAVGCNPNSGALVTVLLNAVNGSIKTITQTGGADEVWYNPGDNRYYVAAQAWTQTGQVGGPPAPVLGIIDAGTQAFVQNVPTSTGAHSVAVDPVTNHAFVPLTNGLGIYGTR